MAKMKQPRDFRRWILKNDLAGSTPYWVPLRLRNNNGDVEQIWTPMRLPWEVMSSVYGKYRRAFDVCFVGPDPNAIDDWWTHALACEWAADHPLQAVEKAELRNYMPVNFHSDGVQVFRGSGNQMELNIWSFSVVTATGNTQNARHPMLLFDAKRFVHGQTNVDLANIVAWVVTVLMSGRFPTTGFCHEGFSKHCITGQKPNQPFCGTYRAAFAGMKSDLKEKHSLHSYDKYYGTVLICEKDQAAKKGHCCFGDFQLSALWRSTSCTQQQYVNATPVLARTPFLRVAGFHWDRHVWDMMHVCFHQGVGSHLVATVCFELIEDMRIGNPGDSVDECFQKLHLHYTAWRKRQRLRGVAGCDTGCKPFKAKYFHRTKPNEYPWVSDQYKAWHIRLMCHWIAELVLEHTDLDNPIDLVRATMCWCFHRFISVLDMGGLWLSPEDAYEASSMGRSFLLCYQYMAAMMLARRECFYVLKPKFHALDHMLTMIATTYENPRFHAVWMEEDLAGKVARIAKKTHPLTVEVDTLFRYDTFFLDRAKRIQESYDAM
jgi:hypothetical protein